MIQYSTNNGNLFDIQVSHNMYRKRIAVMFKIVRLPKKIKPFFNSLDNHFHWNHFDYFQTLVVLMVFAWGRRNVSALYRHLDERKWPHRSRFNNFLNVFRWSPQNTLQLKASELINRLSPKSGDTILLIIDDSKKQKRGKHMQAVGWIKDPLSGCTIKGHQYVTATLSFRGYTIPFGIRLYLKKEDCPTLQKPFKKVTEMAAELIEELQPPADVQVRVLFDSYYLCPVVVKACRKRGFHFVSTLKSNRNLFKNGRKLKAGTYGPNLFKRSHKKTYCRKKSQGMVRYRYIDAGQLKVSDLGKLHVIFSRKNGARKPLGLVTDDPKLSAIQIIKTYNQRWSIEVFFKDSKQLLGLGQYQNLSYEAAVTHLHLVCFAYALLTHIAIDGESAKRKSKNAVRPSTADLQNELRRIIWDDLTDHLKQFPSGTQIIKELKRLLIAAKKAA
jgi:SRSO17 transposase